MKKTEIQKFIQTIEDLRDPQTGCPWNLAQTHASLKRYLVEESYETLEAIDAIEELELKHSPISSDNVAQDGVKLYADLKEELGDMLLQILLHARIAEEKGFFDFEDVAKVCNDKMILRHPHVFKRDEAKSAGSAEEVDIHWEAAKKKEKAERKSIFEGIPLEMPALARAWKISKKAVRESFEWDREDQLWEQLDSEIQEFKEVVEQIKEIDAKDGDGLTSIENHRRQVLKADAELELGDILFTVVNIARWFKLDPEDALRKVNAKFIRRFNKMVEIATAETKTLHDYKSAELEKLWQTAKRELAS